MEAVLEHTELKAEISTFCLQHENPSITTQSDLDAAESVLKKCFDRQEQINATFDQNIRDAHTLHSRLLAQKREFMAPVTALMTKLKNAIGAWSRLQEEKRRAEIEAAEAAARKVEEDKRLASAQELQDSGETEAAEAVLCAPVIPIIPAPAPAVKPSTVTVKTTYTFEIVDASKLPREYLIPDEAKIGRIVRAAGKSTNIAGVRVLEVKTVAKKRGL